jgi:chromosome segregation ATPase
MCLIVVTGCATTDDLRRVRGEMDRQVQMTNDRIGVLEQEWSGRRQETALLRKEIEATNAAIASLRGLQAERRADTTELREQLQQLRGATDHLRRDLNAASAKIGSRDGDEKALRGRLDSLTFKVNFLENFLGIGRKEEMVEPPDKGPKPAAAAAVPTPPPLR